VAENADLRNYNRLSENENGHYLAPDGLYPVITITVAFI
jgi:hypothetical protein